MSDPTITVTNLDIGPQIVTYNGVELGGTLDNVVLAIKYNKADMKADQAGDSVLDRAITGVDITVTTSLAETRNKDIWKVAFPNASKVTVGPQTYIQWNNQVAERDYSKAAELILHPKIEAPATLDHDHYFWKALATEESSITLGFGEQYKLNIVWRIFPDTSVTPYRWYRHGDNTI